MTTKLTNPRTKTCVMCRYWNGSVGGLQVKPRVKSPNFFNFNPSEKPIYHFNRAAWTSCTSWEQRCDMFKEIGKEVIKGLLENSKIRGTKDEIIDIIDQFDSPHRRKKNFLNTGNYNLEPAIGALVYCQLFTAEHSGIYLRNRRIAQLSGKGNIEIVSLERFPNNITTLDKDIFIPVNQFGNTISLPNAARNAKEMVSTTRSYHLLFDNCHLFCAGCILDDFENANNFLWMVKDEFLKATKQRINWQCWEWY